MTEYEATQTQRYIERQIRKYKREIAGLDAAGLDSTQSKELLKKWQERQRDFIDQTGLKRDWQRERVQGYSRKKSVANSKKSGIIDTEFEFSPRKSSQSDFSVDWSIIHSTDYTQRLSHISDDKIVQNSIYTRANWALNNRDGQKTEELYAISLIDGSEIDRITNQHYDQRVARTQRFTHRLNEADKSGDKILLIHNHPRGLPPSIGDINALLKNDNVSGITVGHDGSIYYYSRPNSEITDDDWNIVLKHFNKHSEITAMEKALEVLGKKYGFTVTKL